MSEKKIKFIESKTAHRIINGLDVSDDEWERRLRGFHRQDAFIVLIDAD